MTRPHSIAPPSSMRRVKKACVSSSAIPSRWSTQPSRVTLMLKVNSPMAATLLRVRRTAGLSLVDLVGANGMGLSGGTAHYAVPSAAGPGVGRPNRDDRTIRLAVLVTLTVLVASRLICATPTDAFSRIGCAPFVDRSLVSFADSRPEERRAHTADLVRATALFAHE